jgi:hypothetical protein
MKSTTTSVPLPHQAAAITINPPEWLRVKDAVAIYRIGRTTVFSLIRTGIIRSVSLKKKGNIRGLRLISKTDFDQHLASLSATAEGQSKEVNP